MEWIEGKGRKKDKMKESKIEKSLQEDKKRWNEKEGKERMHDGRINKKGGIEHRKEKRTEGKIAGW